MPVTANQRIVDAAIRHQIFLLRYSATVRNKLIAMLNKNEPKLARAIRARLKKPVAGITTSAEWKQLRDLLFAITDTREQAWAQAHEYLASQMQELALTEPTVMRGIYATTIPVQINFAVPGGHLLRAIALSRPFHGRLLKEWADNMKAEDIRRIHGAIQAGMTAGETTDTIVRKIMGTGALQGRDGVTQMTRNNVEAVVRTAVQHVANSARQLFYDANKDIVKMELFVATLDSHTTPICRSLDGQQFKRGKGPQPPLHFGCRSIRVAAIDAKLMAERPAKPTSEKQLAVEYAKLHGYDGVKGRADLPRGTKGDFDKWARGRMRELVGPIPATQTYQTWLKDQSVAFQEEILGKAKAKLYRQGGLTLDKFVDSSGRELTLHELAAKHRQAFIDAGLDPEDF